MLCTAVHGNSIKIRPSTFSAKISTIKLKAKLDYFFIVLKTQSSMILKKTIKFVKAGPLFNQIMNSILKLSMGE